MIEFNGYISGETEKYLWKNSRLGVFKVLFATYLVIMPLFVILSFQLDNFYILLGYMILSLIFLVCILFVPNSKDRAFIPKKVFTDNKNIVVVTEKQEQFRLISDATVVKEYDEFYFIEFPFGQKSDLFVCQKSLLTKGTLEEFEALFPGKIERHTTK